MPFDDILSVVTLSKTGQLEHFILTFGLESREDAGRATSITQLCQVARETLGEVDVREMQDAIYNIRPEHATFLKFLPNGTAVDFNRYRKLREWRKLLNADFNIRVQPGGRIRIEDLEAASGAPVLRPPLGLSSDDIRFATLAVDEARKSIEEGGARPKPKVGAVIVKEGKVLAKAHRGETPYLANHAEYIALEKKLKDEVLIGSVVYTTLEPCTTRNPPKVPCAERLVDRRIGRVVIGTLDPDPRITGRGILLLRNAGIAIDLFPPELMSQLEELNRDFTRDRQTRFVQDKEQRQTPDAWLDLFREKQNLEEEVASLEAQVPAFSVRPQVKAGKDSIDLLNDKIKRKKRQLDEITERITSLR